LVFCFIEELPIGVVDEHEDAGLDVFVRLNQGIDIVDKLKNELKLESEKKSYLLPPHLGKDI